MKRILPIAIVAACGFFMIIAFLIPLKGVQDLSQTFQNWYLGVIAFFVFVGILNLARNNVEKIAKKRRDFGYSIVLLIFLVIMMVAGFFMGGSNGRAFLFLFDNFQVPLSATMFSLLAFFVTSAAFRAFRARNAEATLLLCAAVIVMVGRVPIGYWIWHGFPNLVEWIMNVPNTAAKRGIIFGADLGLISMSLRILLGIERSYMGGGRE